MRTVFVLFLAGIALCGSTPVPVVVDPNYIPEVPGDNSHYVEGVSRYIWMPDGEGVPHLVDLHEEPSEDELSRMNRNGADNQYWLFTRSNPTSRQVITNGNVNSIRNSNYNGARPLAVIVHGWQNNGNTDMNPQLTAAFLAVLDCNVIVVDWSRLAGGRYDVAARGVPGVGQHLGNFLNWLLNNGGGNWNSVHLVGFSLGAHIVGNAGRTVGNRAARITGLDPAGPNFGNSGNALRAGDAQHVEAIHTDGRILGIMDPIGRANFYPNGGRHIQPGCSLTDSPCSHGRAVRLMEATILHNHLVGRQCNNLWEAELSDCRGSNFHMGNANLNKRGSGIYGLITRNSFPF